MRILSIDLESFRGTGERRVELAPRGVTLVVGPNEIGKSSLAEAVDLLFDRLDSSSAQEVRSVQPVGRDVGPRVEVEVETGPYRFRYAKRFLKERSTELHLLEPERRDWTGREAHDQAEEILGETLDRDLWRALRIEQGAGVAQADLSSARSLMAALDRAAGSGGGAGQREEALWERVVEERSKYYTDKRGDPTGELRQARQELEEAGEAENRAAEQLRALEEDVERSGELEERLGLLSRRRAEAAKGAEAAEERARETERLETELRRREEELGAARRLTEALEELERLRSRRRQLRVERRRLQAARDEARQALEPASEKVTEAEEAAERAEALARLAEEDEKLLDRRRRQRRIEGVLERQAELAERRRSLEERLEEMPVDAEALQDLEDRERAAGRLEAALAAGSPEVEVRALRELSLRWSPAGDAGGGTEEKRLGAGEAEGRRAEGPLTLELPGVAEVTVRPGGEVEDQARRAAEARRQLEGRLEELGCEDLEEARRLARERRDAEGEIRDLARRREELLGGLGPEELERRLERIGEAVEACLEERAAVERTVGTAPPAPRLPAGGGGDEAAFERMAEDVSEATEAARRTLEAARRELRERTEERGRAREALRSAEEALGHLETRVRETEEALERVRRSAAAELRPGSLPPGWWPEASQEPPAGGAPPSGRIDLFGGDVDAETGAVEPPDEPAGEGSDGAREGRLGRLLEAARERRRELGEAVAGARAALEAARPSEVRRRASEARGQAEVLARRLQEAREELEKVRGRLEVRSEEGLFDRLEEARSRAEAARRRERAVSERAAAAERLYRAFEAAREAARRSYRRPLEERIAELGREVFGDRFSVELDEDLCIVRRRLDGEVLEWEQLSTGTREQLSVIFRLACALLVEPEGGVPLILDDVLGYSDPERLQAMGRVLNLAGERCQVIVLTSFPERYRAVEPARRVEVGAG